MEEFDSFEDNDDNENESSGSSETPLVIVSMNSFPANNQK